MKIEKHEKALQEALDEIKAALDDPRGLIHHQRRLALMISLGIAELIEIYFHKLEIIKKGSRIKHDWLKKKNVKERLSRQITAPLEKVNNMDEILSIANELEEKRNDLAYASPVDEEKVLKEQINGFLDIKKIIEEEIGDLNVNSE